MDQVMSSGRSASSCSRRWTKQITVALTPLMEGPQPHPDVDPEIREQKDSSCKSWFRVQRNNINGSSSTSSYSYKKADDALIMGGADMRLLLGVLASPLAPIPIHNSHDHDHNRPLHLPALHIPIERSTAHYIIQQYLAATGCLSLSRQRQSPDDHHLIQEDSSIKKNMYATGSVKMRCFETDQISSSSSSSTTISRTHGINKKMGLGLGLGGSAGTGRKPANKPMVEGCFLVWQIMNPGMWSLELVVGGNKVVAGSDGNIVWRHTPWLGTHAAKGPQRPLRRIIQGLDPKRTGRLFEKAECLGEKRIGEEDCFVLKVAAERWEVMERNQGSAAEVIRHVLYGYFSQKSGLLIYMEDSHLTRVQQVPLKEEEEEHVYYWETSIGSSIGDYREVDGLLIAHQGRTVATVLRFGEEEEEEEEQPQQQQHMMIKRTTLEEVWRIDDIVFNVPGLSFDSFIPPSDVFHASPL